MHEVSFMRQENYTRYPRLDTVLMVERFIDENSGEYKVYQLWKNLPKKVMYQTYKIILSYLIDINKIAIDSEGKIGYIWSEKLGQKYKKRSDLKWE
ncbi:MAG: hypothetical protein NUV46_00630 [Nanoarchaeota archaeon]|nr:hypothetical protein [Nanoarchaeota archaeon]